MRTTSQVSNFSLVASTAANHSLLTCGSLFRAAFTASSVPNCAKKPPWTKTM